MDNPVTLFTIPRDSFDGFYGVAMNNAIESWTLLEPCPEIMLFGNSPDVQDAARRFGCVHRSVKRHGEWGIPFIDSAIKQTQKHAKNEVLCFSNTDIIFLRGFHEAVGIATSRFPQFLMIGRRYRVELPDPIDFSSDWRHELGDLVEEKAWLGNDLGIDYWIFKRGLYQHVPKLLIGRRVWHCWLVWEAVRKGIPIIDATEMICAVHQDPVGRQGRRPKVGKSFKYNIRVVGAENAKKYNRAARIGKTKWVLTESGKCGKRKKSHL